MSELPPPYTLGLPEQFTDWRTNQARSVSSILDCEKRVYALVAPTGSGKSLIYMTTALLSGKRACVLTATKALQDQLERDYGDRVCVVKGRQAYECRLLRGGADCSDCLCGYGIQCAYRRSGCAYHDQLRRARAADIVVTNYHFWCANYRVPKANTEEKIGEFGLLICDEAHNIPHIVGEMFTVEFQGERQVDQEVLRGWEWGGYTPERGLRWAKEAGQSLSNQHRAVATAIKTGAGDSRSVKRLKVLGRAIERVTCVRDTIESLPRDEVLWSENSRRKQLRVAPIWPYATGGQLLFQNIEKILLTSATVRPKTLELVGLKPEQYTMAEQPHTFPVKNRVTTWLPTIRLNYSTTAMEKRLWHMCIGYILRTRLDRNGIIHSVSYSRAKEILAGSEHARGGYMIGHGPGRVEQVVRRLKNGKRPVAVVSPALSTGYDFPYDQCRYQIITKVPYPDTSSDLMSIRCARDEDLAPYMAMVELVQMCGRAVRNTDDWSENFVIDDNISWFMKRYGKYAPRWFMQTGAYKAERRGVVPEGR